MLRATIATLLVCWLGLAEGASPPTVSLAVDPCVEVEPAQLAAFLRLELHAQVRILGGEAAAQAGTGVALGCAEDTVTIRLDDRVTRKQVGREIDTRTLAGSARARLLAIALAELLTASWMEATLFPEPSVQPKGPPPRTAEVAAVRVAVAASRPMPRTYRVLAMAALGASFGRTGLLAGAALRAGADHRRGIAWAVDVQAQHGSVDSAIGEATIDVVTGAALLGYGRSIGIIGLRALGGARVGAARIAGNPATSSVRANAIWGAYAAPVVQLALSVAPTRRLALELVIEAGYGAARVEGRANGEPIAEVGGATVGAQLGIGLFP